MHVAELDAAHAEITSMRTARGKRGRGVASVMVAHLIATGVGRGYGRLSLETGSQEFFAPARRLYARHGFDRCGRFGERRPDPNSVSITWELTRES